MISTSHSRLRPLAIAFVVPLLVTACSGGGDDDEPTTPEDVLAEAKTQLDETAGVNLSLSTEQLPEGIDGLLNATGYANHAPGFDGTVEVRVNSIALEVPVIALEGLVFAELPFTKEFNEIDPENYGAPDPATFMDTTNGVSAWLTAAEGVEEGDETRDGELVLTTYTGTVPGSAVAEVIPSASPDADFDATFSIDDEGRLTAADIAGPFYGDAADVDYRMTLDDYGTEQEISRP